MRYLALLDNIDTFDESSYISDITPFKAVLNDMYAKDISKKIRSVCRQKRENGQYISTYPPYGYIKDINSELSHLKIDDYSAYIVKRIFDMYISGIPKTKICDILNCENVEPPAVYMNMNLSHRTENYYMWKPSSIQKILKNEVYIGTLIQGKTKKISYKSKKKINLPRDSWIIHKNAHTPIIEKDVFEKAQQILKRKHKTRNCNRVYLLKGIIYCYNCGNKLNFVTKVEKYKDRKYERRYLFCSNANKGKCKKQYNNYDKLEKAILEYIKEIYLTSINTEVFIEIAIRNRKEKKDFGNVKLLKNKERTLNKIINQIYNDRLNRCN